MLLCIFLYSSSVCNNNDDRIDQIEVDFWLAYNMILRIIIIKKKTDKFIRLVQSVTNLRG